MSACSYVYLCVRVFAGACGCVCVYMCVCLYNTFVSASVYLSVGLCLCMRMFARSSVYQSLRTYVYVYACARTCLCVCGRVCVRARKCVCLCRITHEFSYVCIHPLPILKSNLHLLPSLSLWQGSVLCGGFRGQHHLQQDSWLGASAESHLQEPSGRHRGHRGGRQAGTSRVSVPGPQHALELLQPRPPPLYVRL